MALSFTDITAPFLVIPPLEKTWEALKVLSGFYTVTLVCQLKQHCFTVNQLTSWPMLWSLPDPNEISPFFTAAHSNYCLQGYDKINVELYVIMSCNWMQWHSASAHPDPALNFTTCLSPPVQVLERSWFCSEAALSLPTLELWRCFTSLIWKSRSLVLIIPSQHDKKIQNGMREKTEKKWWLNPLQPFFFFKSGILLRSSFN